jgi:hypothetical protein
MLSLTLAAHWLTMLQRLWLSAQLTLLSTRSGLQLKLEAPKLYHTILAPATNFCCDLH